MARRIEKQRRTELRRKLGLRKLPEPHQPRGRHPRYTIAHACFDCRKSFKVTDASSKRCPQCGAPLHEMGRAFKAPPKHDTKQWKKVQLLWEAGLRFWSYGHSKPYPADLKEVATFLRQKRIERMAPYGKRRFVAKWVRP